MSKFDERMESYRSALQSSKKGAVDEALLTAVAKGLGPSIYLADASRIACTDKAERDRIKNNFLIKKLGMKDSPKLDEAISTICEQYQSNHKHRAVFYYMLVKHLGMEKAYK